jgi:ferrochelatase
LTPATESAAVILMAYGSPERPEDVRAYLTDIRGGRPVRQEAVDELVERYRRIGGISPLNRITEAQRAALEAATGLPTYVGMKHWHPRIPEAVERALAGGAERLVGLVLAPHYSSISIGGYPDRLEDALAGRAHVAFTAHSLPERILAEGDPYRDQLLETSHLVAEQAGITDWSFAFQSESLTGEPWLGPDILVELERLRRAGVREVLVAPVGFVSDHLEILWDLDVAAHEKAARLGLRLDRIESLNADPAFIRALADIVEKASRAEARIEAQ